MECGNGYLSRMLDDRGTHVVGVEPTASMVRFARELEAKRGGAVEYVQADLTRLPELGAPFDVVVCSMVLMAVPDWRPAMKACVDQRSPDGRVVFAIVHPAFEGLSSSWREHGSYRTDRYPEDYEIVSPTLDSLVRLPNFLIFSARKEGRQSSLVLGRAI